jgi:hypothetical protein
MAMTWRQAAMTMERKSEEMQKMAMIGGNS